MQFVIPLQPVTKKNSSRIVKGNKGWPRVLPSKQYQDYERDALKLLRGRHEPIADPVQVTGIFYMKTRRTVDLTNLLEALDDVLVKAGILRDDNCAIIVSHDGSRVRYDRNNPRTEVEITRVDVEPWE